MVLESFLERNHDWYFTDTMDDKSGPYSNSSMFLVHFANFFEFHNTAECQLD